MADDEQKDNHNDDPHHPALLEKGYHEIKLWQMISRKMITMTINRKMITMTILTIWISWKKVIVRLNYCR
jgi:hypothetical protein